MRREFPAAPAGCIAQCRALRGTALRDGHTVNFRFLTAKLGMVLVVALAASAIDVLTTLAGSERRAGVLEITQPPPGWVDFCARQPSECSGPTTVPGEYLGVQTRRLVDVEVVNVTVAAHVHVG